MKERPIIFNAEMVRAILDGRKTQTRRTVSDRHLHLIDVASQVGECYPLESGIDHANSQSYYREHCPFGKVGDRLWVRETFGDCGVRLVYRADSDDGAASKVKRWIPSIHMPRDDSRITLEITAVRVERLNDISDVDATAEGCSTTDMKSGDCLADVFARLWSSIYGTDSWVANPWVWVVEFKRAEASND